MTVFIVGVGPGDAELMTLKAARLLRDADAVVHDRLIGTEVLDYVSPLAERHDVGKTPGRPSPSQAEINALLVDLGRRLDTVVRVKGGDPFVFGRGIEEIRACAEAGVATEVVPGVTSALAGPLAAGISITERGLSSGVVIVTAHQDPGSDPLDWGAIADVGLTIVVLMGARRCAEIRDGLILHGMSPAMPAAVVTSATHPDQHVWRGPLAELGREPIAAPSVMVIGPVAGSTAPAVDRAVHHRSAPNPSVPDPCFADCSAIRLHRVRTS